MGKSKRNQKKAEPAAAKPVFSCVLDEEKGGHSTRRGLFVKLEKMLRRPVVTCFTSFDYPVNLDDDDADILEEVLHHTDLRRGLALVISSPGGNGLAAERIIKLCRGLSGTGEFWAVVPARAMSAATLVCFGASRILMSPSSQLGPVDPQIIVQEDDSRQQFSAHALVESYSELFDGAVKCSGHIEPYVQQLSRYDARSIQVYKDLIKLSKEISVKSLKSGMMRRLGEKTIEQKIERFLNPELTRSHGRPIFRDEAKECGLRIAEEDSRGERWNTVYELFTRSNRLVSTRAAKCIESSETSFIAGIRQSD